MKKVFRNQVTDKYWDMRWEKVGIDGSSFENKGIYPVKYVDELLAASRGGGV
jgi:hypothetical protein